MPTDRNVKAEVERLRQELTLHNYRYYVLDDPLVSDAAQSNPTLDTIERAYIMWVLENEGGNKARTAEVLGIDSSTLYRKLSRYGLNS